jgi:hypothetical protein
VTLACGWAVDGDFNDFAFLQRGMVDQTLRIRMPTPRDVVVLKRVKRRG